MKSPACLIKMTLISTEHFPKRSHLLGVDMSCKRSSQQKKSRGLPSSGPSNTDVQIKRTELFKCTVKDFSDRDTGYQSYSRWEISSWEGIGELGQSSQVDWKQRVSHWGVSKELIRLGYQEPGSTVTSCRRRWGLEWSGERKRTRMARGWRGHRRLDYLISGIYI